MKKAQSNDWAFGLVPIAGIELATYALRMRCSTN